MTKRRQFRSLLAQADGLIAPGVYDCLTAKVAADAGAKSIIVTGAGLAASVLGTPDVGLLTMTEVADRTRRIAECVDIPLIADCDTGYGNPINVGRTIREFEAAGVAALFMEDQVSPKRCGHFEGKQIIAAEEMVEKIKAAVDARVDGDLLIMARTDARAIDGPQEAIRRAQLYVQAGAEMLFVEAPHSEAELELIANQLAPLDVPLMVNLVEGGKTPLVSAGDLHAMGYALVTFSGSMQKTAISSMGALVTSLLERGDVTGFYPEAMVSLDERSELLGLPHYLELEQRYAVE